LAGSVFIGGIDNDWKVCRFRVCKFYVWANDNL